MNLNAINGFSYLGREVYAQAGGLKSNQSQEQTETQEGAPKTEQPTQAQQIHNTERIRTEVLFDYHGLNAQSAREALEQVSQNIAQCSPWKLMETQPVADRSLVPTTYV